MKLEIKYQILCNGAVMFQRSTPEEILEEWKGNYKVLKELAKEAPDRVKVYSYSDTTNEFFPHGKHTCYIDDDIMYYELKTIATRL